MDLDFHEDADAETDEEADEDVDEDEIEDGLSLALPAKVRWRPRRCDCNKEAAAMKLFPSSMIGNCWALIKTPPIFL